MKRREFITLIGGAAVTWPHSASAQQAKRRSEVGVLMSFAENDASARSMLEGCRDALAQLGWVEGKNLRLEIRWAAGSEQRIKAFARELLDLQPDLILVQGTISTASLARETRTIPLVFVNVADPLGSGLVASLAHPGGNVTGFVSDLSEQGGKWVGLLREIAPSTKRIVLLSNPETGPSLQLFMPSIQAAASSFNIEVSIARARAREDIEGLVASQASVPGSGHNSSRIPHGQSRSDRRIGGAISHSSRLL